MAKPVRLRRLAADDIEAAAEYLIAEADPDVAIRFIAAVEHALRRIGRHPHTGSLRFSYELDIPDLRALPLTGFPYVVFYVEGAREIAVWRILHQRRDMPSTLTDEDIE